MANFFPDFAQTARLGFQSGMQMSEGQNPLGQFIKTMLADWQQRRAIGQEYGMKLGLTREEGKIGAYRDIIKSSIPASYTYTDPATGKPVTYTTTSNVPEESLKEAYKGIGLPFPTLKQTTSVPEDLSLPPGIDIQTSGGKTTFVKTGKESPTKETMRLSRETLRGTLTKMEGLLKDIPSAEGIKGRGIGFIQRGKALAGYNTKLQTYNDFKQAILGQVTKVIGGETGSRLSDQDVKRMSGAFPSEFSTTTERDLKWKTFKSMVNDIAVTYGSKPMFEEQSIQTKFSPEQENLIQTSIHEWGRTREEVIEAMRRKGYL